MTHDRRAFLRNLMKGAAYATPVIYTLSTPRDLQAIVVSGMIQFSSTPDPQTGDQPEAPWSEPPRQSAPWDEDPPWGGPPPGSSGSSGGGG